MDKLNIAFYTDSYLPGVDGVVTSILNSKAELERRGHKVYIFASANPKLKKKYERKDVFLYDGAPFKPYPQYNVAFFPYNSVFKLNELDIDLIHAHTPMVMGFAGMMGAKLSNVPLVGSFHTMITNKPVIESYYPKNRHIKRLAAGAMTKYIKFFYKTCDQVIAPTATVGSFLRKSGVHNVSIVPNSIDTDIFNPRANGAGVRRRLGIRPDAKVILYLGRLSKEKKVETLLKAAAKLIKKYDDVQLVIGGTGPAEHHYMEIARRLGINHRTKFIGFVSESMLPQLYASADVVCLPSTFETQGIVMIEAMAVGTPVVGADFLAIKEMIHNGKNGEKFRPGDYADCSKKIEKVLNNTEHYKHSAIETAERFSKKKVADSLIEVYNLVLSNKGIY